MRQIIAMHGWGSDANAWQIWATEFQHNGWIWQSAERGYGEFTPFMPSWKTDNQKDRCRKKVVICHSLGIHLIDNQLLSQATDIVLLSSFSRFIPDKRANRSISIALKGMKKALGGSMEKTMLLNFMRKSSKPHPITTISHGPINSDLSSGGRAKLQDDIELLSRTNALPIGLPDKARVLVISGTEDSIIIPSSRKLLLNDLNKHLLNPLTYWPIDGAGHSIQSDNLIPRVMGWLE